MKNTMSFGDGDNDNQMLKEAGIGVAMLNASDNVKKYADQITEHDNNDAGVGRFLN
jgi:hydroxymethylpyrimidine pyrophosphatase-like HAD family hydrolase